MAYPNSNLPSPSQPWGREIQKNLETVQAQFLSERTNNTARDAQLQASYKRLDATVVEVSTVANQAAYAASTANSAISAITSLGTPGSSTIVNASNIIGGTLKTATGGRHTEITASEIQFFDNGGSYSGRISAADDGRASSVEIETNAASGFIAYNGGSDLYGPGSTISAGNNGNGNILLSSAGGTSLNNGLTVSSGGASITGNLTSSARITCDNGLILTNPTGTASTSFLQVPDTRVRSTSGGLAVFVASNGTYHVGSSSRRFKQDILDYAVDYDAFLKMNPVTFRYKSEVEEVGESAGSTVGFIAEELQDLGLHEYVVLDDEGDAFGINYSNMVVGLTAIVAKQDEMIKSLTARIEALESKV